MIPHSATFTAAVRSASNHPIFETAVLDRFGNDLFELNPDGGSVRFDRTQPIRGGCTITLHGDLDTLTPPGFDHRLLLPYGTEIRISKGYEYADGSHETVSRGVFRITSTDISYELGEGITIVLTGSDRSERLNRELIVAFDSIKDARYGDTIVRLLQLAWQGASKTASSPPFQISKTEHLGPPMHFEARTNAWDEAMKMATACAKELYADHDGAIALMDLPNRHATLPVWQFVDGQSDTRVRLGQNYSSDNTPNYWTVNAMGPGMEDKGVFGVVWVDDQTSSLSVDGAYGTNPRTIDSIYATSQQMCIDEARAERTKVLAGTDTLEIETRPIPFLVPGDVVLVDSERLGVQDETYVIVSLEDPLTIDATMLLTVGRG